MSQEHFARKMLLLTEIAGGGGKGDWQPSGQGVFRMQWSVRNLQSRLKCLQQNALAHGDCGRRRLRRLATFRSRGVLVAVVSPQSPVEGIAIQRDCGRIGLVRWVNFGVRSVSVDMVI